MTMLTILGLSRRGIRCTSAQGAEQRKWFERFLRRATVRQRVFLLIVGVVMLGGLPLLVTLGLKVEYLDRCLPPLFISACAFYAIIASVAPKYSRHAVALTSAPDVAGARTSEGSFRACRRVVLHDCVVPFIVGLSVGWFVVLMWWNVPFDEYPLWLLFFAGTLGIWLLPGLHVAVHLSVALSLSRTRPVVVATSILCTVGVSALSVGPMILLGSILDPQLVFPNRRAVAVLLFGAAAAGSIMLLAAWAARRYAAGRFRAWLEAELDPEASAVGMDHR